MTHTRYCRDKLADESTSLLSEKSPAYYSSFSASFSLFKAQQSQNAAIESKYKGGFKPSEKLLKLTAEKQVPIKHSM